MYSKIFSELRQKFKSKHSLSTLFFLSYYFANFFDFNLFWAFFPLNYETIYPN